MRSDIVAEQMMIFPGEAGLITLDVGQRLDITDEEGHQVADLVAFAADCPGREWLSPTHTRAGLGRMNLRCGDELLTNLRLPILALIHDDVGVHDMSVAMCDRERYRLDFGLPDHLSCQEAMAAALSPLGIPSHRIPDPVNVFQNTTIRPDGRLETNQALSRPGDKVAFVALIDAVLAVTACPQDQTPCNGWKPTPVTVRVSSETRCR